MGDTFPNHNFITNSYYRDPIYILLYRYFAYYRDPTFYYIGTLGPLGEASGQGLVV